MPGASCPSTLIRKASADFLLAIGSMNGHDFAALLERAIARSNTVRQIEGRCEEVDGQ